MSPNWGQPILKNPIPVIFGKSRTMLNRVITFNDEGLYIESKKTYAEKALAVDQIIEALLVLAATEAGSEGVTEYSLNDGQVQIRTVKRGVNAIMQSIQSFEKLKQYYIVKSRGTRMTRLVDGKSFVGPRCW